MYKFEFCVQSYDFFHRQRKKVTKNFVFLLHLPICIKPLNSLMRGDRYVEVLGIAVAVRIIIKIMTLLVFMRIRCFP